MRNRIAAKSLTIKVCAAVLSLSLLTLGSCNGTLDTVPPERAVHDRAEELLATHEAAMAIEGIATYEARATREAEATEAAATVAAQATATAAPQATATATAQATERPVPSEVCTTAGASCLVEGKFKLDLYFAEDSILENWVNIVFPVDGGAVSGGYHWSNWAGYSGAEWTCVSRYDYPGTLSGNYDPASGRMEGSVHGGEGRWTVLEGCENEVVEHGEAGTGTSWWAMYDAVRGHVEGAIVFVDVDGEETELTIELDAPPEQEKTTVF